MDLDKFQRPMGTVLAVASANDTSLKDPHSPCHAGAFREIYACVATCVFTGPASPRRIVICPRRFFFLVPDEALPEGLITGEATANGRVRDRETKACSSRYIQLVDHPTSSPFTRTCSAFITGWTRVASNRLRSRPPSPPPPVSRSIMTRPWRRRRSTTMRATITGISCRAAAAAFGAYRDAFPGSAIGDVFRVSTFPLPSCRAWPPLNLHALSIRRFRDISARPVGRRRPYSNVTRPYRNFIK